MRSQLCQTLAGATNGLCACFSCSYHRNQWIVCVFLSYQLCVSCSYHRIQRHKVKVKQCFGAKCNSLSITGRSHLACPSPARPHTTHTWQPYTLSHRASSAQQRSCVQQACVEPLHATPLPYLHGYYNTSIPPYLHTSSSTYSFSPIVHIDCMCPA